MQIRGHVPLLYGYGCFALGAMRLNANFRKLMQPISAKQQKLMKQKLIAERLNYVIAATAY